MNTVSDRLKELITSLGYNPTSFSKELGYTNNNVTIGRILSNTEKMPSAETMIKISDRFERVNLDWLLTGKGEMLLQEENKLSTAEVEALKMRVEALEREVALKDELLATKDKLINVLEQQAKPVEKSVPSIVGF